MIVEGQRVYKAYGSRQPRGAPREASVRTVAAIIEPRMLPIPPSTTKTKIMMDILYPKFLEDAARMLRLWE